MLSDTSIARIPASAIAKTNQVDSTREAKLAHRFIQLNAQTLAQFSIEARVDFDGATVFIVFRSGSQIGAFPLISPISGKAEITLIVRPRFGWSGLGRSLGLSGFKVIPEVLQLQLLPKTEREIPPWILSATILPRLKAMLASLSRRFEIVEDVRIAPRGSVDWGRYVTEKLPAMKFMEVPCRYPDLRSNRELFAAIHYVLRKQLASLETQRHAGMIVIELMQICMTLLRIVADVKPLPPTRKQLDCWFRAPLASKVFFDGLHAITWSTEETGLGGMTDWSGLPWVMSMEQFYEAWVETVFQQFTKRYGGVLRVGRRRETITPIAWERPFLGSQKYLLPDLVIEQEDRTIFVDAKYKDHLENLQQKRWTDLEDELRERHRDDLLQVLAYSTLSDSQATTACLAYPCTLDTWISLKERGMLSHKAAIYAGRRKIELAMVALPMGENLDEMVAQLGTALV
ncbi:MAG: hypothetical protein HZB31_01100 [Nitrospirae bacterium]|nr:hypothetical protein [Nitrospirota bacterium]